MTILDNRFGVWTDDQKLTFPEVLSHELTVAIRMVWSENDLPVQRRLEQIKWLNEIHHRVPMRARAIRKQKADWTGPDAGLGLEHRIDQDESIRPLVEYAVRRSIRCADEVGTQ